MSRRAPATAFPSASTCASSERTRPWLARPNRTSCMGFASEAAVTWQQRPLYLWSTGGVEFHRNLGRTGCVSADHAVMEKGSHFSSREERPMPGNFGRVTVTRFAALALMASCLFQLPTGVMPSVSAASCDCMVFFLGGIPAIGFIRGESIRITVSDPATEHSDELRNEPARAQVTLFDHLGNQIAQSPEFSIPRGGFHSVEFSRDSIPLSGEPGTGRLEAHPTILLRRLANPHLPSNTVGPIGALELVDSDGRSKIWIDMGAPVRISPEAR